MKIVEVDPSESKKLLGLDHSGHRIESLKKKAKRMNIKNEIKIFRKQLKQDFAIGILLFTRELMRTYKKSRMGMLVVVIPAITGALLTITLSAPENGTTRNMDMQMMLLWLALVDIGAFPIRINKRIRPLILTLVPDAKSIFKR